MKILVADDDAVARLMVSSLLTKWGYEVSAVDSGAAAWHELENSPPSLALLDWLMPDLDGLELCRRLRSHPRLGSLYVIMLTSLTGSDRIVEALSAGANDYVSKPFQIAELKARIEVGQRVVQLYDQLQNRVQELESALAEIKQLQGILPICSYCKKVRDDQNYWQQVEKYIAAHSTARFSHGICPDCYESVVKPQLEEVSREMRLDAQNRGS